MDEEDKKDLEKYAKNPDAADRVKFHAELLLLFDKYDPINPDVSMDLEEFLGIIDKEKSALLHHYLVTVDEMGRIPPWEKP